MWQNGSWNLGPQWKRTRLRVLKRDGYICQCEECKRYGRIRSASEVDHIVPRARGGTDEDHNLQAINRDCHKRKTIREQGKQPATRIGLDGFPVIERPNLDRR